MSRIEWKGTWILGAALGVLLGAEASAQTIYADNLVLPQTGGGRGFVLLANEPFLHAWDAHAAGAVPSSNTFLGRLVGNIDNLPANQGRYNTGVGSEALHEITTGWHNTAVGNGALRLLQTGSNNTAVGGWALAQNVSGDLNAAFGSGSLGFNTTGSYNAAFGGLPYNTTGSYNTALGQGSLFQNGTGWGNTAVGTYTLLTNRAGSRNTTVGYQADVAKPDFVNATAIGANAVATASNMVRIGSASVTVIQGQVPFSWVSDRRWKKDIESLGLGLEFVRKLRPVSFRLKDGNDRLDMGFVAQEVAALLGENYNAVNAGTDPEHLLSMRTTDFIAPLVRAVQEVDLQRRADQGTLTRLAQENAALKGEIAALRDRLAQGSAEDRARIDRLERALQVVVAGAEGGGPAVRPSLRR